MLAYITPNFLGSFPYFPLKSPPSPMVFSYDFILLAAFTVNWVEEYRQNVKLNCGVNVIACADIYTVYMYIYTYKYV